MPAGAPVRHAARPLLALSLLLALVWQSLLVQIHAHLPSLAIGPAAAGWSIERATMPADRAPADPQSCPICRAAAQVAHYLSPGTVAIPAPLAIPLAAAPATFLPWPGRHVAPGWHSRGPPASVATR